MRRPPGTGRRSFAARRGSGGRSSARGWLRPRAAYPLGRRRPEAPARAGRRARPWPAAPEVARAGRARPGPRQGREERVWAVRAPGSSGAAVRGQSPPSGGRDGGGLAAASRPGLPAPRPGVGVAGMPRRLLSWRFWFILVGFFPPTGRFSNAIVGEGGCALPRGLG